MTTKNKAIVALVCGILGIVGGNIPVVQYVTGILAIVGIVFGALALKDKPQGSDKGMAIAGLVCGIVAVALTIIAVACAACAVAALASGLSQLY